MRPLGVAAATALLIASSSGLAAPGPPPQGYLFSTASSGVSSLSVQNINQLVFKPGDSAHVYASRGFSNVVTRYDYNAVTGQLSNPNTVVNLSGITDQMAIITGLGFHGDDLWITRWKGVATQNPAAISRLRDGDGNGTYETRTDFVTGINLGGHTISQIQINGNSLYTGLGVRTNTGNPTVEDIYNGTVVRIGNLNDVTTTNLTDPMDRGAFEQPTISDGKLRKYAGGFRNPFGIRLTDPGEVWVSDNGQDPVDGATISPDWLYRDLQPGDSGRFPGDGSPGAPNDPVDPFANLGSQPGVTGFDFIPTGPHRGDVLMAFSSPSSTGRRLKLVNGATGTLSDFMTGFTILTDVVLDPFGRLLVADHNAHAVYLVSPPPDGDANLDRLVDITDLTQLALNWQTHGDWSSGDFDRSGFIDEDDLGILAMNWDNGAADATSLAAALTAFGLPAVPEPAGGIALCAMLLACRHRSSQRLT